MPLNKRKRIPKGNTMWTIQRNWQHRVHKTKTKTKQKHNTICVGYHYAQTNTNNVSKTWALLQVIGGKDEPNIVLCRNGSGLHNTELST